MRALYRVLLLNTIVGVTSLLGLSIIHACTVQQARAAKSAYDIGVELCELYYGKHTEMRTAMSAQDVCKLGEVVQPFVDHANQSDVTAGQRSTAALRSHRSTIKPIP